MPDVNVWLALVLGWHPRHRAAMAWFDPLGDYEAALCRISQMGLLRLLTNRKVLGSDTLAMTDAWKVLDRLAADPRVLFLSEPDGLESEWRSLTRMLSASPALWTGRYLLAFARRSEIAVVTFDRVLASAPGVQLLRGGA